MKYLFLLHTPDDGLPGDLSSPEYAQMYADYSAAVAAMAQAGVLVDCAPLRGWSSATTVRVRDGETLLTDGPAAEIKEQVGGYTIVECAGLDEALEWAATIPAAAAGSVEVRSVVDTQAPL
ncbi:MAG: YciI family protein [Actinomycetota bacterium]